MLPPPAAPAASSRVMPALLLVDIPYSSSTRLVRYESYNSCLKISTEVHGQTIWRKILKKYSIHSSINHTITLGITVISVTNFNTESRLMLFCSLSQIKMTFPNLELSNLNLLLSISLSLLERGKAHSGKLMQLLFLGNEHICSLFSACRGVCQSLQQPPAILKGGTHWWQCLVFLMKGQPGTKKIWITVQVHQSNHTRTR